MSHNVLLEIGVEEIPHEILTGTLGKLKENSIDILNKAGVEFGKIYQYGTPRRLAIQLIDVSPKTEEKNIEKKGPVKKAAYDDKGQPTKALLGFLNSNQASVDDIEIKEIKGNPYVFLNKKEGGEAVEKTLPGLLKQIILSFNFPKTMRWGNNKTTFARPIRWIVALMDEKVIPLEIENIKSGQQSLGKRFLEHQIVDIQNPMDYKNLLKEKEVIVDQDERKTLIQDKIEKTAQRLKATPVLDNRLLDTLINLTEYPEIAVGKFDTDFLELPKEVLISEMIDHQKYVPLEDSSGKLQNNFVIITNNHPNNDIVKGNERVIRARFSDGKFFFDEDRKKKLEDFLPQLEQVAFGRNLGSLKDKTERLEKLVALLSDEMGLAEHKADAVRTARLCKADLVTNMVNEFDELQGVMGYYYAIQSGEKENVAVSIKEHYTPKFSGDALPSLPEGILVSLADRIDNLFALYSVGKYVTGSKDPYALRRQTLGIIRILIEKEMHLDFSALFDKAYPLYEDFLTIMPDEFKKSILDFITTRIKTVFKEYDFSYDEIESGITGDVSDIYDSYLRIAAIHKARESKGFEDLAVAFKRVKNIIKDQKRAAFDEKLLQDEAEKALYREFNKNEKEFVGALDKRDYAASVAILTSFREPVDRFFDEVLVMADDAKIKDNRIALLSMIDKLFLRLLDFDKIVVE